VSHFVVAIDPDTLKILWKSTPGSVQYPSGIAVLPALGIAVVGSFMNDRMVVHSLIDGREITHVEGDRGTPIYPRCIAADPRTGRIFVNSHSATSGDEYASRLAIFTWNVTTFKLEYSGCIPDAGRLFTVVSPIDGRGPAHLVAGSEYDGKMLRVLSLDDYSLVGNFSLGEGAELAGLSIRSVQFGSRCC